MSLPEENNSKPDEKRIKKIFRFIGRLIRRVFGKARWFLIGIVFSVLLAYLVDKADPGGILSISVTSNFYSETFLASDITASSVNRNGWAELEMSRKSASISALVNIDTGEQRYAHLSTIDASPDYYTSSKTIYGEDGRLYTVITDFKSSDTTMVTRERVVSMNEDFEVEKEYCTIDYDENEGLQASKLSMLTCADGKIMFARLEQNETRLYSIDMKTQALTISDPYPTEPDGTFTFEVLPVGDSFLFSRSDGNVYRTRFGEPLGESIFRFEEKANEHGGFFRFAAAVGDKLYVYRLSGKGKLYCLENGALTEVLDIHDLDGRENSTMVIALDSYRPEGADADQLAITLDDGLVTFDGNTAESKSFPITVKNRSLSYVAGFDTYLGLFCMVGLLINLIIRKKTLLYKQIAVTLPILMIPAIAVAINRYLDSEEENMKNIEQELDLVCQMGVSALDGYDFSQLSVVNEKTGAAARKLQDKLDTFDPDKTKYIFSVVKRTEESKAALLSRTDRNVMPLYYTETIVSEKEIQEKTGGSGNYLFKEIQGLLSDDATYSEIYVLGRLASTDGEEYYLKVKTNNWNFWRTRTSLFFKLTTYIVLITAALTLITMLTSMYITRTIKKATKAVEKISGGDLSARIDYHSKDELGEICSQVNGMAQSLESLFAEKDKTERFYYKFVPEKFRELLGKESFTDLRLGDAISRELTVLFFDIRSFSINSEIMTAKENFEFVNIIYGKAGPIVRKYGGFIDKYIGDAVMALFENPDDAVNCGIELYKAIVLDKSTAEAIHISDINIGIGIHSGMARIGIVGESERLSGTVISDTVNLSSRLESLTKQYKTAMLISKDTVDRMTDPDSLGLRYLGIIQVAGVNEVKAVYEVLDCLPEKERTARLENGMEFREAIRLFHLGRRSEAADILRRLKDSGKNDHVTDMYLDYISSMSEEDKGNVFRFVRK